MVGSSDRRHLPAGHPAQLIRGESENGARGACGGPNLLVLKQGFVENGLELPGVANRRNASDGETRPLEHEAWIGLEHRLMDQSMDLLLIDSMCAACNDQDWTPGILGPEDDRLGDLPDRAANRLRGLLGSSRACRKLNHAAAKSQGRQRILNSLGARAQFGCHGKWPPPQFPPSKAS